MDVNGLGHNRSIFFETSVSRSTQSGPEKCLQHYHNHYEIYCLEKGNCNYLIDNRLYTVAAGDVVLIPSGIIHKTSYDNQEYKRILLHCANPYIPECAGTLVGETDYIYRNPEITKALFGILKNIEQEYYNPDPFSEEMIKGYIHAFFVGMSRNRNHYVNSRTGNMYVEKILEYLHENFSSELSLNETAKRYSVSPEHLSRSFKKETGLGFNEYVTTIRMKHAEQLLKRSDSPSISEIALNCGYNDSNYFSKIFKSVHGVAPLKYKKAQR